MNAFQYYTIDLVKYVVVALLSFSGGHPALLEQIGHDAGGMDDVVLVEVEGHPLAEATAVGVAHYKTRPEWMNEGQRHDTYYTKESKKVQLMRMMMRGYAYQS